MLIGTTIHEVEWELEVKDQDESLTIRRALPSKGLRNVAVGYWDGDKIVVTRWISRDVSSVDLVNLSHVLRVSLAN